MQSKRDLFVGVNSILHKAANFQFVGAAGILLGVEKGTLFLLLGILRTSAKTKKRAGCRRKAMQPALKCFLRWFELPIYSGDVSEPRYNKTARFLALRFIVLVEISGIEPLKL